MINITIIEITQTKRLKQLIDPLVNISEDIHIEVTEEGLHAQAADPGKSWAGDIFLASRLIDKIEVKERTLYSVKLKDLADFLKTSQNDDILTISENTDEGALELELSSEDITKKILLRLNDASNVRFMQILSKDFGTNCQIGASLFEQAIRATELGGDQIQITHTQQGMKFESKGTTRSAEATINYDGGNATLESFETSVTDTHIAIYKLDYLKIASRVGKSEDTVKLSMQENAPLRVVYSFDEEPDEDAGSHIAFAIAPRVKGQT